MCSSLACGYSLAHVQNSPSTAKLLATYIINLVLVIYRVFADILPADPPRALEDPLVFGVLARHNAHIKEDSLDNIDTALEFTTHPERVIEYVIRKRLELPGDSKGSIP